MIRIDMNPIRQGLRYLATTPNSLDMSNWASRTDEDNKTTYLNSVSDLLSAGRECGSTFCLAGASLAYCKLRNLEENVALAVADSVVQGSMLDRLPAFIELISIFDGSYWGIHKPKGVHQADKEMALHDQKMQAITITQVIDAAAEFESRWRKHLIGQQALYCELF
jgi:hypothetical protein